MVFCCAACPASIELLKEHLFELAYTNHFIETIECQQWPRTDQIELVYSKESIMSYVDLAASQLEKFTSHSHITNTQAKYLKVRRGTITVETALFLGDLIENYSFLIQVEIQSFQWSKQQCFPPCGYLLQGR